jgi:hypothetical protein
MTDRWLPMVLPPLLVLSGLAYAAAPAPDDAALVTQCRNQLAPKLFAGGSPGDAFVTAKAVERQGERIIVRLSLASGEGRAVSGTCIFRDGKLFDVK